MNEEELLEVIEAEIRYDQEFWRRYQERQKRFAQWTALQQKLQEGGTNLSVWTLAGILKVHPGSIRYACQHHKLPYSRGTDGRIRFSPQAVAEWFPRKGEYRYLRHNSIFHAKNPMIPEVFYGKPTWVWLLFQSLFVPASEENFETFATLLRGAVVDRILSTRENEILSQRFRMKFEDEELLGVVEDPRPLSFREIGKRLGVSRQRVHRIFRRAMRKLRAAMLGGGEGSLK